MVTITGDVATTITAVGGLLTIVGNFVLAVVQLRTSRDNKKRLEENTVITRSTAKKMDDVVLSTTGNTDVSKIRAEHKDSPDGTS